MATGWRLAIVFTGVALLFPAALEAVRPPSAHPPQDTATKVRSNDPVTAALLKEALRRSETIRALVAEIEASDLLVVVAGWNERGLRGWTQLTASSGLRVLIVRITMFLIIDERIAVLGHELQHAREISAAPEATSDTALRQLFARIGDRTTWSGDRYETTAAIAVERRVREEVRRVR